MMDEPGALRDDDVPESARGPEPIREADIEGRLAATASSGTDQP